MSLTPYDILKIKKDALVASLTQLSHVCNDASRAAIEFYSAVAEYAPDQADALPAFVAPTLAFATAPASPAAKRKRAPAKKDAEASSPDAGLLAVPAATPGADETEAGTEDEPETVVGVPKKAVAKKARKEVDPDAPRRPPTVYFTYANSAQKLVKAEFLAQGRTDVSHNDVVRAVAERWRNMTPEEKKPWDDLYREQLAKYEVLKEQYNAEKASALGLSAVEADLGAANGLDLADLDGNDSDKTPRKKKVGPARDELDAVAVAPNGLGLDADAPARQINKKRKHKDDLVPTTASPAAFVIAGASAPASKQPDHAALVDALKSPKKDKKKKRKDQPA
ncbi:uncharacterized protein V1510DRAFT_270286 [Dipodascopsis tothii]|uniref:uncharacterized protein n=1 Tax=Dipodascopsis tothii TaxID=44089 RepID=UPI0034CE66F0